MKQFAEAIASLGGRAYEVGGCVRDSLMGRAPHDFDIAVTGLTPDGLLSIIPDARCTGRSFPVFRAHIGGAPAEVALARTESKTGPGHGGFSVSFGPRVSIEDDLMRRDITVNAIARDILTGRIVDPSDGRGDIARRTIRAVSDAFTDDALRALRAARFAAQLGFDISSDTYVKMRACSPELGLLPPARTAGELERALEAPRPSVFFHALERAGILGISFPGLGALGREAFDAALARVDRTSSLTSSARTRFAALMCSLPQDGWGDLRIVRTSWRRAARCAAEWAGRICGELADEDVYDLFESLRRADFAPEEMRAAAGLDADCAPWLDGRAMRLVYDVHTEIPDGASGREAGELVRRRRLEALSSISRRSLPPSPPSWRS